MKNSIFFSRAAKLFYLSFGGLVVFIFIFDSLFMPWYVNKGGTFSVPNVVGMKEEEAVQLLEKNNLEARRSDIRIDKEYPIGYVVAQNPNPSQIVKNGRRVYLTISGGEQTIEMPSLRGNSLRNSKFVLDRYGLMQGTIVYQVSTEFPEGTIISQGVLPGTKIKRGTYVGVTVSAGESIDSISVPNVIGKSLAEAQKILVEKRLKVGYITYQVNADVLPNTVIEQTPQPSAIVTTAKTIDLFIVQPSKIIDKKRSTLEN